MTSVSPGSAEARIKSIERLFIAYKNKDRPTVEALFSEDFSFTSSYDDAIDRDAYFERCWPNSGNIKEYVLERIAVDGTGAFVTYCAYTYAGSEFRNTEFLTFSGSMIRTITMYFGPEYKDGVFTKKSTV